ncbi:DUF5105 domain-containing protein [Sebaldella sp. S0638]|uniref:DUF5105 domain-containing protein n=1 Tax=Sebaldella sp. S0638 TaxID=2957809 RepID=UPI00209CFB11|nr:DUF5105 domain-containing protein [Sebaldella sp. S0638]MCP1224607.1 DUF5105 domain-containing protein [Sebaldella sp. S0638]
MKKLFIFVMMFFLVISCGKPKSQKDFEGRMSEIQSADNEKALNFLEEGTDNAAVQNFEDFYLNFFKKVEYKVLSAEEKENESILQVEIKAPNVVEPFIDIFQEGIGLAFSGASEEEMEKFFNDSMNGILQKKDITYLSGTIPVYMTKNEDGEWEIDTERNSELFVYLTGGLSTFAQQ